ncbi:conserved hypothetical protein [Talaromyces stipitatus ATCC 10500]|uniref:F-box domain protein n=1 Tax=Talaromyces stipitatus (strain ATCC 10500 / CBS 375.48 / QM 6759 / NRRL 1006) TaxID=441959 RepID=B8MJW5_TALSN|nr:uncharacterized protein TSTA_042560 [Talaromyces stipitatus ATCC 10500]EED14782.1 conserved hypothetical protein [Talaromyces stipitatus ATCC 10500]
MDAEMDIPLFFRVSTMAALSTSTLLPLDNVMSMELGKTAPGLDPINVPDVVRLRSEQDCDEAFQLLMSILRQPELGLYIRHIDILRDTQFHGWYKPTPYQRFITEEDGLLLRLAVRNAGWYGAEEELVLNMLLQRHFDLDFSHGFHSSRSRGGRHTRGSHMIQSLAALLMSVCPNLESLKIRPIGRFMKEGYPALPLEQFLLHSTSIFNSVFLQRLRRVDLLHTDDALDNDPLFFNRYDLLYHMSLFHQLPSIEHICVGGMEIDENGREDFAPLTSNLGRIELLHSVLPTMFLCSIIASSKTLRHFTHSVGGRATQDTGNWHMAFPAIFRALLIHRESLESLNLDTDADYSDELEQEEFEEYLGDLSHDVDVNETEEERKAFMNNKSVVELVFMQSGSLRNFTALRRLNIGVRCLFHMAHGTTGDFASSNLFLADVLPPHLESLSIRGYQPGMNSLYDAHIQDLFQKFVAGQLGSLKEIYGISEYIPNSATVHLDDVDRYPELVWIDERDAIV